MENLGMKMDPVGNKFYMAHAVEHAREPLCPCFVLSKTSKRGVDCKIHTGIVDAG